jgi:hypothetical protein
MRPAATAAAASAASATAAAASGTQRNGIPNEIPIFRTDGNSQNGKQYYCDKYYGNYLLHFVYSFTAIKNKE